MISALRSTPLVVQFHDDKSLYTGVYANGGPSAVDKGKISDISQTCNRGAADVRGNLKWAYFIIAEHITKYIFYFNLCQCVMFVSVFFNKMQLCK